MIDFRHVDASLMANDAVLEDLLCVGGLAVALSVASATRYERAVPECTMP